MDEQTLSEKDSLDLINRMLVTAKGATSETGILSILWGSVIGFCSLVKMAEYMLDKYLPFDIFILTIVAVIPTIIISVRENKRARFKSYSEAYVSNMWLSFGIGIFVLIVIMNVLFMQYAPAAKILQAWHGPESSFRLSEYTGALFMMLYGMPTFATGMAAKFKPMIWGGLFFWICALVSLFTHNTVDLFLQGASAIVGWLIPGIILWKERRNDCHV